MFASACNSSWNLSVRIYIVKAKKSLVTKEGMKWIAGFFYARNDLVRWLICIYMEMC